MTSTNTLNNEKVIDCRDTKEWETWLGKNHDKQSAIWLRIAKKDSGKKSVTISDALDVALCYGWIDSQRRSYDVTYYLQRYSPRRKKSPWSKINIDKANKLIAAKRMQPSGLEVFLLR